MPRYYKFESISLQRRVSDGQGLIESAASSRRYSCDGDLGRPRFSVTLHRRSLRRHFQTAAFLLERRIVPAVLERLSDLDRPEDLARWPGPLE